MITWKLSEWDVIIYLIRSFKCCRNIFSFNISHFTITLYIMYNISFFERKEIEPFNLF